MLVVETVVRIRREYAAGKPIKAICRDLRLCRKVVRKAIRAEEGAFSYQRTTQPFPKIGPVRDRLVQLLTENEARPRRERLRLTRVWDLLVQEGYDGSYDSVRRYAARWREETKTVPGDGGTAFVPLMFAPGEAFQFDFSHEDVEVAGQPLRVKAAHVRLCASRAVYVRVYPRETQEMVFDAHARAFAFFGGVPTRGIYDNMKTAVDAVFVGKARTFNRRFLLMADHYMFEPTACTPASGWEKGQVENQVRISRERFFKPRLRFATLEELNGWLEAECRRWARLHPHPEQREITLAQALEAERPALQAILTPFDGFHEVEHAVTGTCLITFDRNRYSVMAKAAKRTVQVRAYADKIVVRCAGEVVAEHARSFYQVQMRKLFPDGKAFVDATPKHPPAQILAAYRAHATFTDAELKRFVTANFDVPAAASPPMSSTARTTLKAHIATLWPVLTRPPVAAVEGGSALQLDKPFVVPGGRFREMYYWDSYFTMLGLAADGQHAAVENMVDNFGGLIKRYGHIPNGTRTYYLSRSQPPFYFAMVGLADKSDKVRFKRRVDLMRREHAFWMDGETALEPGQAYRRVVALPDGAILNRYADDRTTPRDESYREDVLTARKVASRPAGEVFRDLRSGAESGWDYSSRWMADGKNLKTIQTTSILPVDLNSLLYGLETAIAEGCADLADRSCVEDFTRRAQARRAAIDAYLWDGGRGIYLDYQWRTHMRLDHPSAATLYPLFVGAASPDQAKAVAASARALLLAPGGLRTTTVITGQQWDTPNGWAPLQWVAVSGLRRYGERALGQDIGARWLATVAREYQASGKMLEKYDVEEAKAGGGGEYPLQDGFGWTNGVTRALLDLYPIPSGVSGSGSGH